MGHAGGEQCSRVMCSPHSEPFVVQPPAQFVLSPPLRFCLVLAQTRTEVPRFSLVGRYGHARSALVTLFLVYVVWFVVSRTSTYVSFAGGSAVAWEPLSLLRCMSPFPSPLSLFLPVALALIVCTHNPIAIVVNFCTSSEPAKKKTFFNKPLILLCLRRVCTRFCRAVAPQRRLLMPRPERQ